MVRCFVAILALTSVARGDVTSDDFDKRVGQPVDIAPWAYVWRADRAIQPQPEAYFIPRRLARIDTIYRTARGALPPDQLKSIYYNMPDLLKPFPPAPPHKLSAGLLWVGGVSKYQVELHWPADAKAIPSPDEVEVRTYPTSFGWFGWTVDRVLNSPQISADRRTWIYTPEPGDKMDSSYNQRVDAATEMVAVFCDKPVVPTIAVTGGSLGSWKRIDVEIEWLIKGWPESADSSSGVETSVALKGPVARLGDSRRGISLPLLYAPDARPGLDSRITIPSIKSSRFTVRLHDLEDGPVYIPAHGVVVTKVGSGTRARQVFDRFEADHPKALRAMTREHSEAASWEELMRNVRLWNCPAGTKIPPALPKVDDPPMVVEVSDQHWIDAWRAACGQLRGKHMWGGLAFEVGRVAHEMELVGLHDEAAKVYEHFLAAPGAKSDGDYADGDGALELAASMRHDMGYSHDGTHASTGRLLFAMAERYFLTGDRAWFEKNRSRLQAAADWIIRQRKLYMKDVPNRDRLFAAGLMPPQMLGDYALPSCDWHFYYCDNAFSLQGVSRFADALSEIDPAAAKHYRDEIDAFRHDVRAAAAREAELAPVRRGRDGAYHSFIPRMAYTRGLTGPELGAPQFPDCDFFMGSLPLAEPFAAIDANDRHMIDTIDWMDEAGTAAFTPKRTDIADAWFWTCYTRLPKASHVANIYLLQDDVPNFLRFWENAYAMMVGANGKFWESWSPEKFDDCTNPDNGTAGWFLENFRNLLVMEDGDTLWLARATPRAWLEQGQHIRVKGAPTYFGATGYEIVSDVDHGSVSATLDLPTRRVPQAIVLRVRQPKSMPIKQVTVNGKLWEAFDSKKETITLKDVSRHVTVIASYE